jgi:cytosine/adenosine deaminase-related metal-dependent hydrolase
MASGGAASTGRALFDGALQGGAQALGVKRTGLVEGAIADIVSLDAQSITLAGRSGDAILDSWIFGAGRSLVDCVWAGGRKVVQDGRHQGREAVAERFRRVLKGLLQT